MCICFNFGKNIRTMKAIFNTNYLKTLVALLVIIVNVKSAVAQISGGDAFVRGSRVQIGVEGQGGFEGANAPAPAGYNFRGGFGLSGMVSNPLASPGWANFNGDFFTPGAPENGWGLVFGNTAASPGLHNNRTGGFYQIFAGSALTYTARGTCFEEANWSAAATSGTNNVQVSVKYLVGANDSYFTTIVTLTNTSTGTIPTMYYYRNIDPDNNQSISGNFMTNQLIENQPTTDPCNVACVSASQPATGMSGASYIGFAAIGAEYRATYGGFTEKNAFNMWNSGPTASGFGTPFFVQTPGSANYDDEAIQISCQIQNFLPGTTRTIRFVTILDSSRAAKKAALVSLINASSSVSTGTVAPPIDVTPLANLTIYGCGPVVTTLFAIPGFSTTPLCASIASLSSAVSSTPTLCWYDSLVGGTYLGSGLSFITPTLTAGSTTFYVGYCPDSTSCTGGGAWTSVRTPITVNVIPVPVPINVTGVLSICSGASTTLSATPGLYNYNWSPPTSLSSSTTATVVASPTITTTYTVSNGIGACYSQTLVTVVVNPIPTLTISASSNTICANNSVTLTANASIPVTYTWSPAGTLSAPNSAITTASPLGTTTYSLLVSVGACTNSASQTINVVPSPILAVLTVTNTTCGLCNGSIEATASAGLAPYTYSWAPSTSTQSVITGLCEGTYNVMITDANNCKSTFNSAVAGSAIFQASLSASTTDVFAGEPITLTGIGGVTYTWSPSTSLSCVNCPVTIATPAEDITYCVEATSVDGCKDTACIEITIKCGDVFVPNAFSPNNDGHNDELMVYGNCIKDLVFRVYDRWGELVFESYDTSTKWDGKYKGFAVNAGVFIYQLSAKLRSGEVVSKKGNITVIK